MDVYARPVPVALLIGSLAVGGAETQLARLANGLDRARFRRSIICLRERIAKEYSTQRMVSHTEAVYEEPLARLSPTRTVG